MPFPLVSLEKIGDRILKETKTGFECFLISLIANFTISLFPHCRCAANRYSVTIFNSSNVLLRASCIELATDTEICLNIVWITDLSCNFEKTNQVINEIERKKNKVLVLLVVSCH